MLPRRFGQPIDSASSANSWGLPTPYQEGRKIQITVNAVSTWIYKNETDPISMPKMYSGSIFHPSMVE